MSPRAIPDEHELSNSITLELSDRGGHVGFISGGTPKRPRFWLEKRIIENLSDK